MKKMLDMIEAPLAKDDGRQERDVVCLANEARFTAANFSQPLTTFAVGFQDPANLQGLIDQLFPPVEVPRRFEFKNAANAEAFLSEGDDLRAIGSSFKRVEFAGASTNQKTLNKGLTVRLDRDEDLVIPGAEERAVSRLINRLLRNELRRGIALLVAGATNVAKTWATNSDPDQDVLDAMILGGDARGLDCNLVLFGRAAWQIRCRAFRAQDKAGAFASAMMNPQQLGDWLGATVVRSGERYQSDASTKSKVVGSYVLAYFAQQNAGKDDPSNVKRFFTPTESGPVRVYREEHAKYVDVSVEHYSNIVVTSTLGIRQLTIS